MYFRFGSVLMTLLALSAAPALAQQPMYGQSDIGPAGQASMTGDFGACGDRVTIEAGDTLGAIAERCGTSVSAIQFANPDLPDPRSLSIGTEIIIPDDATAAAAARSMPGPSEAGQATSTGQRTHIIQQGDTWDSIAEEAGINVKELMAANPDVASVALNVGQRIQIPASSGTDKGPSPKLSGLAESSIFRGVRIIGDLTGKGVECPVLRALDGTLYTLSGDDIGEYSEGDRVVVTGAQKDTSTCMQGTTIAVDTIAPAS